MQFPITVVLALILLPVAALANPKAISIGAVKESRGAPDVLRNPQRSVTAAMKKKAESGDFVLTLFEDRYWEAYRVTPGMKLFYGDQLKSGNTSEMHIALEHGIEITLAPNTTVRLSRGFIKEQNQSLGEKWVSLISGTIRAKARGESRERKTGFRTKSIAMGVRGTDFVVESKSGVSKLVTLEGKVAVRPVSQREHQLFEAYVSADTSVPPKVLEMQTEALNRLAAVDQEVIIERGMKVESLEPSENAESMGMALTSPKESSPAPLVPVPVSQADIELARTIAQTLEQANDSKARENLETLEKQTSATAQAASAATSSRDNFKHGVDLALTNISLSLVTKSGHSNDLMASSLSAAYNWHWHPNFSIGALFVAGTKLSGTVSGLSTASTSERITRLPGLLGINFAGRYSWGSFSIGGSFNIWMRTRIDFESETDKGTESTHLNLRINPMIRLHLGYRFTDRLSALFEVGGTNIEAVDGKEPPLVTNLELEDAHDLSIARLGIGYAL